MANFGEDVIELGSSDEETEPAPKKKRPLPNAMVHIPNKLPGVTIKPASKKPKINPVSIVNSSIGKGITVTKVSSGNKLSNPFATKNKQNGKPTVRKPTVAPRPGLPILNPALTIRPTLKKIQQVVGALKVVKGINTSPSLLRPLPQGTLPPGITVKRTSQLRAAVKPNMKMNPANIQVKKQYRPAATKRAQPGAMVCVNLDDDDASQSSAGPQWYLRPEEQEKTNKSTGSAETSTELEEQKTSAVKTGKSEEEKGNTVVEKESTDLQEQNNKEPETPDYIEITIEDSPAKPQPKRTCEVAELAITIDDSPAKGAAKKPSSPCGSDEDTTAGKEKNSKKKLEYPETVEIEIELTPVADSDIQNYHKTDSQVASVFETEIVEIVESPIKPIETFNTSTPKKKLLPKTQLKINDNKSVNVPKPQKKIIEKKTVTPKLQPKFNEKKTITLPPSPEEFHPVYQSFINLCFQLENSEDMRKIVEKKIKAYYKQVPKEYTESEVFTDMVASKVNAMKAVPEKMYLFIKDVVDELNLQRKIAKTQPVKLDTVNEEEDKFLYGEESEFDSKRQRQIRKLEKTLKKLHRAIQKLEEQEVDFDDEEDSVYLLTESEEDTSKDIDQPFEKSELLKRYKERMIRVHAKFCQLTNTKMPSEPRVQIDARPGQHKGPAKRLEKWINKKVPIGTPLTFPDFHDVLRCVRDANQEDNLGWNEADIMEEARDLFTRCGKKLQRRRQENEWRLAASRIQSELDPAEGSEELKKKLEDNRRVASKKESEVLNKYADRQNQLNLEAVEIGDKEADESPVETDDDEPTEERTSLETKAKRKDRLKRLLQEKSKKVTDAKEKLDKTKKPDNDNSEPKEESEVKEDNPKDHNPQMETENVEIDPVADEHDEEKVPLLNKEIGEEKDPLAVKGNKEKSDSEKIHSLSDDSNHIDSDIDELHLLQKLHSDVIDSSTLESSDSESPIAISDTLSSGDNRKQASDVISIENSSYSESEKNNEQEYEIVSYFQNKIVTESVDVQMEIECSSAGVEKKINKSNNDEYNESVEDILLASSDEETNKDAEKSRGDPISIDETNVEQSKNKNTKNLNKDISDKNADITDASSMESIEITGAENVYLNAGSAEVTSIAATETGDDGINTNAVETGITSVETVENEKTGDVNDDAAVNAGSAEVTSIAATETGDDDINTNAVETGITPVETVEDEKTGDVNDDAADITSIKSTESVQDELMTSIFEEIADEPDEIINAKSVESVKSVEEFEITIKSTESVQDEMMTSIFEEIAGKPDEIINAKSIESVKSVEECEITINPNENAPEVTILNDGKSEEITSANSVQTAEDEIMANPAESNTDNDTAKDETMASFDEQNKTADKVNSAESAENEIWSIADNTNSEVTGRELEATESLEENVTTTPDESKVANDEVNSSDVKPMEFIGDNTKNNSKENKGSTYIDVPDVNNTDTVEDLMGLLAAEPMEVDTDMNMT